MSVQLFSISISTRRIFLGDSEQVIDISNIVIHRKNGLLVNVSPLGAARESALPSSTSWPSRSRGSCRVHASKWPVIYGWMY